MSPEPGVPIRASAPRLSTNSARGRHAGAAKAEAGEAVAAGRRGGVPQAPSAERLRPCVIRRRSRRGGRVQARERLAQHPQARPRAAAARGRRARSARVEAIEASSPPKRRWHTSAGGSMTRAERQRLDRGERGEGRVVRPLALAERSKTAIRAAKKCRRQRPRSGRPRPAAERQPCRRPSKRHRPCSSACSQPGCGAAAPSHSTIRAASVAHSRPRCSA